MSNANILYGSGVDSLFGASGNANEYDLMVNLDDIEIGDQVRKEFENEDNKLVNLGRSLRKKQIQPIILRVNRQEGSQKPYLLVAGERRCRAAKLEGLTQLWARVQDLSDNKEARVAQIVENIHRKELTLIEEAEWLALELETMTIDEVMDLYNISRTRLSKIMGLLDLPEQAKRLVDENLSDDVEAINAVKIIERINPDKAKALVDDIRVGGAKANVRDMVKAVKNEVKPPKPKATKQPQEQQTPNPESVNLVLSLAYSALTLQNIKPAKVLDDISLDNIDMVDVWLRAYYDMGKHSKDAGRDALKCLRDAQFSSDGVGAFALAAFMHGVAGDAKFSLITVFGSIKS